MTSSRELKKADFKNFSQQNLVDLKFIPLKTSFDFLNEVDLIINASSLGMINQQKLDIDISNAASLFISLTNLLLVDNLFGSLSI